MHDRTELPQLRLESNRSFGTNHDQQLFWSFGDLIKWVLWSLDVIIIIYNGIQYIEFFDKIVGRWDGRATHLSIDRVWRLIRSCHLYGILANIYTNLC